MGELLTDLVKDIRRLFMLVYSGQCKYHGWCHSQRCFHWCVVGQGTHHSCYGKRAQISREGLQAERMELYARKVKPEGKDGFESKLKDLIEPGNLFQVYWEFVSFVFCLLCFFHLFFHHSLLLGYITLLITCSFHTKCILCLGACVHIRVHILSPFQVQRNLSCHPWRTTLAPDREAHRVQNCSSRATLPGRRGARVLDGTVWSCQFGRRSAKPPVCFQRRPYHSSFQTQNIWFPSFCYLGPSALELTPVGR